MALNTKICQTKKSYCKIKLNINEAKDKTTD